MDDYLPAKAFLDTTETFRTVDDITMDRCSGTKQVFLVLSIPFIGNRRVYTWLL